MDLKVSELEPKAKVKQRQRTRRRPNLPSSRSPLADKKSSHHIVKLESDAEFVAREPWLRDNHFRRTDREAVTNVDAVLGKTLNCKVLTENGLRLLPLGLCLRVLERQ